jgi:creatinine amidohydrolase
MMRKLPLHLAPLTTDETRSIVEGGPTPVVLLPVGSTEPHGPHLPLSTDVTISEEVCRRAARSLRDDHDVAAFIAPAVPYGVTDFAEGFAGAISLPADLVQRLAAELCRAFLRDGWHHVSMVNNHLEPEHVAALHAAAVEVNEAGGGTESAGGTVPVSFPNVLSRRWGATLTDEFKSGACHAGRYESSLVLAADADAVRREIMSGLPPDPTSISDGIRAGKKSFRELGNEKGYFGDPAAASKGEGEETYEKLRLMVVTEVLEALGRS